MGNFAQRSDLSLKQLGMIENHDIRTRTANDLAGISTDGQKGISPRNTHHARNGEAAPKTKAPLDSVNLEDNGIYRHWSLGSQVFVGGDMLLTALDSGWEIAGTVLRQEYLCISNRCTYVYHLELHRDRVIISMRVIENPWVKRMLRQFTS